MSGSFGSGVPMVWELRGLKSTKTRLFLSNTRQKRGLHFKWMRAPFSLFFFYLCTREQSPQLGERSYQIDRN